MSETYNVRERSFIKVPEAKTCITCGQPLAPEVKPMSNHMNKYLNKASGKVVVHNSNEDIITIQGVQLHKVIGKNEDGTHIIKTDKTPATVSNILSSPAVVSAPIIKPAVVVNKPVVPNS